MVRESLGGKRKVSVCLPNNKRYNNSIISKFIDVVPFSTLSFVDFNCSVLMCSYI